MLIYICHEFKLRKYGPLLTQSSNNLSYDESKKLMNYEYNKDVVKCFTN